MQRAVLLTWQTSFSMRHILRQTSDPWIELRILCLDLRQIPALTFEVLTTFLNSSNAHALCWNAFCLAFLTTINQHSLVLNHCCTTFLRHAPHNMVWKSPWTRPTQNLIWLFINDEKQQTILYYTFYRRAHWCVWAKIGVCVTWKAQTANN